MPILYILYINLSIYLIFFHIHVFVKKNFSVTVLTKVLKLNFLVDLAILNLQWSI